MIAVKTFDSTGVAPNGRLFAGDLNAIQAAAAGQSDFTQTIDLGTLRIGDSSLSISKIGAGELQVAADLRVTKILRGLEGIIPGAYTTTQRDAIAAGRAPYGIAILNSTKNIWEWNSGSDGARAWAPFGTGTVVDTLANRPAASSVVPGTSFFATDQVVEYVSNGSSWLRVSMAAGIFTLWGGAAAPTGWVLYDGGNLPSSTGIYADLATHLGGVAKPDWKGRVAVGLDAGQAEFDALGETGGAKTHTLTIAEMPSHNHSQTNVGSNQRQASGSPGNETPGVENATNTGNQGGGNAHNNLQPYRVCHYIGKL